MYFYSDMSEKQLLWVGGVMSVLFLTLFFYHFHSAYLFKSQGVEKLVFVHSLYDVRTRMDRVISYSYEVEIDGKHYVIEHDFELRVKKKLNALVIFSEGKPVGLATGSKADGLISLYISVAGGGIYSIIEIFMVALVVLPWGIYLPVQLIKIFRAKIEGDLPPI